MPGLHAQVEPASRSPLAASRQASHSNSCSRSHEGFVSVSSASRSSGSQHGTNNSPAPAQSASESSNLQSASASPSNAKDGATTQGASGIQSSQISALDSFDGSSRSRPDAADPFKQSVHALHAEQQESQSQAPGTGPHVPASHQSGSESKENSGAQQDSLHPNAVTESRNSESALQVPTQAAVRERKASDSVGTAATSSAASERAGSSSVAAGDVVNASPVGSASTDAWEMVQDATNIYNWKAGSLFGRSLSSRRQGSACSEEGESYSQCEHSCRSQHDKKSRRRQAYWYSNTDCDFPDWLYFIVWHGYAYCHLPLHPSACALLSVRQL